VCIDNNPNSRPQHHIDISNYKGGSSGYKSGTSQHKMESSHNKIQSRQASI